MMAFALTPDGGYPRLIRFGPLPSDTLATLSIEQNVLVIDRAKYDTLTKEQQDKVLRTHHPALFLRQGHVL